MLNASDEKWKTYWKKRVVSVYVPYCIAIGLALIFEIICYKVIDMRAIIVSLLGMDMGINIDPSMWFISFIGCFYFWFWCIKKIERKYGKTKSVIVGCILWTIIAFASRTGVLWNGAAVSWIYVFSFPLGYFWSELCERKQEKLDKRIWLCVTAAAFIVTCMRYGKVHIGLELLVFSYAGALIWIGLIMYNDFFEFKILQWIGKYSFSIYLVEGFYLRNREVLFDNVQNMTIQNFFIFVVSIVSGFLLQHFIFDIVQNKLRMKYCL